MEPVPVPQPRPRPRLIDLLRRACEYVSFRALLMRFLRACGAAPARGQPRTAAEDKQDEERTKAAKNAKAAKKREKQRDKKQKRNADNAVKEAAAKKAKKVAKKTAKAAAEAANKAAVLDEAAIAKSIASTSTKAGRAPNPGHHALDRACAAKAVIAASPRDRAPNAARALKAAADSNGRAKDAPSQSNTKAGRAPEPGHHALDRACAAKDARNVAAKNKAQTVFAASPRDGAPNAARALKAAGHSNGRDKDAPSQSAATSASPAPAGPSCSTSTRQPQPEEEELSHLSYWKENREVKNKKMTPCMICFLDPESKLRDYANTDADIHRHGERFHKGGVKHCAQKGCFVIGKDRKQIGMHQFYAHKK